MYIKPDILERLIHIHFSQPQQLLLDEYAKLAG